MVEDYYMSVVPFVVYLMLVVVMAICVMHVMIIVVYM